MNVTSFAQTLLLLLRQNNLCPKHRILPQNAFAENKQLPQLSKPLALCTKNKECIGKLTWRGAGMKNFPTAEVCSAQSNPARSIGGSRQHPSATGTCAGQSCTPPKTGGICPQRSPWLLPACAQRRQLGCSLGVGFGNVVCPLRVFTQAAGTC